MEPTNKIKSVKPKARPRYREPTEKHRLAARLILMGYSEYAALRAVGYSHRVVRKYAESACLRVAIREAFLEQQRIALQINSLRS
jgi:hypothetical protein